MPQPPVESDEPAEKATLLSWLGFLLGLALYLMVSATFDWMPQDDLTRGLWFTLGLVPAFIGFAIGLVRAEGDEDDAAQRDNTSRSSM